MSKGLTFRDERFGTPTRIKETPLPFPPVTLIAAAIHIFNVKTQRFLGAGAKPQIEKHSAFSALFAPLR
jgi:hypothetical protein